MYAGCADRAVKTAFLRTLLHEEQLHLFTPHQLSIHDFISCVLLSAYTLKTQILISRYSVSPSIGLQARIYLVNIYLEEIYSE